MAEQRSMGMGKLGSAEIVFKRKFRFTFEIQFVCDGSGGFVTVPEHFVKVAARPSLSIEETQIDFLNGRTWIPGKGSWETISVTYNDVAHVDMGPLYQYLTNVYEFVDNPSPDFARDPSSLALRQGSRRSDYTAWGIIKLWDGCGVLLEEWILRNMWPTNVNWGDLSYSDSEISTIELTLRYSDVSFKSICPSIDIEPCCTPCDGSTTLTLDNFQ